MEASDPEKERWHGKQDAARSAILAMKACPVTRTEIWGRPDLARLTRGCAIAYPIHSEVMVRREHRASILEARATILHRGLSHDDNKSGGEGAHSDCRQSRQGCSAVQWLSAGRRPLRRLSKVRAHSPPPVQPSSRDLLSCSAPAHNQ